MVTDVEPEFASDTLEFAEFISCAVGAIEIEVKLLFIAPKEGEETSSVESLLMELTA